MNQCEDPDWKEEFEGNLKKLEEGEYLEDIISEYIKKDNKKELENLAHKAKSALRQLKKLVPIIPKYELILKILSQ
ncbi:MAG: hypothetical protein ACTSRC_19510 [Candidatus Helarchaeota archaeon]